MKLSLAIVALAFSGAVFAQSGEFWFSAGESILENKGIGSPDPVSGTPNDYQLGDGFRFGFRFDLDTRDHLGYEISYFYSRSSLNYNVAPESDFQRNGNAHGIGRCVVAFYQAGFAGAAVCDGRARFHQLRATGIVGGVRRRVTMSFKLNYGAGVKVKVGSKWGKDWGIRADVRQFQYFSKPFGLFLANGKLKQTEATVGFGLLF